MKYTKFIALLVLFMSVSGITVYSQQIWAARYNGTANFTDVGNKLVVDDSANVYVTGYTVPVSGTGAHIVTIKYNSSGVQQWAQTYTGGGNDNRGESLAVDNSGNVYVTGRANVGNPACVTLKYNSSGVQQWAKIYNQLTNSTAEHGVGIVLDNTGNIYVACQSNRFAVIKYNSAGDSLWVNRSYGQYPTAISMDNFSNVYVCGFMDTANHYFDYLTVKFNSSGVIQWTKSYNGPGQTFAADDRAYSIAVDNNLNVYVTGESLNLNNTTSYCTIKYNTDGVQKWVQRYSHPANNLNRAYSVAVDLSGNVFVTGTINTDYVTVKYDSTGNQLWVNGFGTPFSQYPNLVKLDILGNVFVGCTFRPTTTASEYRIIKYSNSGVQQWIQTYAGLVTNGQNILNDMALDNQGNIHVTGSSSQPSGGSLTDIATVKFGLFVGVSPGSNQFPEKYSLSQNYPNPFNPVTVISYKLAVSSFTSLIIYDVLGKEAATLVNQSQQPGTYEVEFDGSNYPSGVYFYRIELHSDNIESGDFVDTKKMLLIK
jgi:hypothetical protein